MVSPSSIVYRPSSFFINLIDQNMKFPLSFLVGMFLLTALGAQEPAWPETLSYEGRFRVRAPEVLTEVVDTVAAPVGKLVMHIFYHQPEDAKTAPNLFYQVLYVDYPPEALHADSTALLSDFWQTTIEQAAESVRGEVVYQADREWLGWPGKVWRISYLDDQAVIRSRAIVARNRFYLVQTISLREKALNPDAERFFESFRLLNDFK